MNASFQDRLSGQKVAADRAGIQPARAPGRRLAWSGREVMTIGLMDNNVYARQSMRDRLDELGFASLKIGTREVAPSEARPHRQLDLAIVVCGAGFSYENLESVAAVSDALFLILLDDAPRNALHRLFEGVPAAKHLDVVEGSCGDAELEQRITRLVQAAGANCTYESETTHREFRFDPRQRAIWRHGIQVHLAPQEFELSRTFFQNMGSPLTRESLHAILGRDAPPPRGARSLDVVVSRIRKRLSLAPEHGYSLRAIYGIGYQLDAWEGLSGAHASEEKPCGVPGVLSTSDSTVEAQ